MSEFTLADAFETAAGAAPDAIALIHGEQRLTYAALAERARRLASYLHARGLGAHTERADLAGHESGQDHVGIALYNGSEYLESMIGCFRARVAQFNVNYRYVGEELRYLLADAGARGLIYHASLAPTLAPVLEELGTVDVLLQVADDSGNDLLPGAVDYEDALASADPAGPPVEPDPDDLYILYTGGTTGMPKGVLWRQHDIFMSAMGGRRIGSWEEVHSYEELAEGARSGGRARLMVLPPFMHGAAQWAAFNMFRDASTVVLPTTTRRLDPADVLRTIEREQVLTVSVVGDSMVRPLLAEMDSGSYDLSSLFAVANGGAPLTPAVRALLHERLPNLLIADGAGSSETGAQMSLASGDDTEAGTFVPAAGTTVLDAERESVIGPGHEGLGWLAQSGWVPLGYLGDPDKSAATFPTVAGTRYAVPGDRARHLADGRIKLLGRDSLTINSGGEKIFVEEVERAVAGHPAVADVVVTGRPAERWGEEVVAVVALVEGSDASADAIIEHAAGSIARFKLPKVVVVVPAVVRSPSGKADYRWARQQATEAP